MYDILLLLYRFKKLIRGNTIAVSKGSIGYEKDYIIYLNLVELNYIKIKHTSEATLTIIFTDSELNYVK